MHAWLSFMLLLYCLLTFFFNIDRFTKIGVISECQTVYRRFVGPVGGQNLLQTLSAYNIYSNKKETSDFHGTVSFDPGKMSQQK